ncbi:MAG: MFS transporter [Chthoniobacterales bacterium]
MRVLSDWRHPMHTAANSKGNLFEPLKIPIYRALWIATIFSNIGTLMQNVGASWMMTSLTPSTTLVGLVQTASTLPVFLVGILAGVLADIVDRRWLLLITQTWMLLSATALGVVTLTGHTTPWMLLALTFSLGFGAAMNLPAWQAIMQDIVPRESVAAAVSLNSMAFNVARSVGPALGGFVVAWGGAASVFFLNALSFIAVVGVLWVWKPVIRERDHLSEDVIGAIRAGTRYVLHAHRVHAPMIRSAAFVLCGGSIWPLLPLMARDVLKTTAAGYGAMLAAIGVGSIISALLLPRFRKSVALDWIIGVSTGLLIIACFTLAFSSQRMVIFGALVLAGMAWIGVLVNFNVAVQTSVPAWVRGRAISFYLLIFQGMLAAGGAIWGYLAGQVGTQEAFGISGIGLLLGLILIRWFPLHLEENLDLSPSAHWPEQEIHHVEAEMDDGPVLVNVEYFVKPENVSEFRLVMQKMRELRLRDGAIRWRLYRDMSDPGRYIELFRVHSWAEHMRQNERFTMDDRQLKARVYAMHTGEEHPRVSHFLSVEE